MDRLKEFYGPDGWFTFKSGDLQMRAKANERFDDLEVEFYGAVGWIPMLLGPQEAANFAEALIEAARQGYVKNGPKLSTSCILSGELQVPVEDRGI